MEYHPENRQRISDPSTVTVEELAERIADLYEHFLISPNVREIARKVINSYGLDTILKTYNDPCSICRDDVLDRLMLEGSDVFADIARAECLYDGDWRSWSDVTIYEGKCGPERRRWHDDIIFVIYGDDSYIDDVGIDGGLDWREAIKKLQGPEYTVEGKPPLFDEVVEALRSRGFKVWDAAEVGDDDEDDEEEADEEA